MKYNLNKKEEQVMQILWRLKKAFVKEVIAEMPNPQPPYNTVSSIVRKLETEGFVAHEAFGKNHRYYPLVKQSQYKKQAFKSLLSNYFENSHSELLSYFVKEEKLSSKEIEELLKQLKNSQS